jgi:molybdate transport system substrate-binding protein
MRLDMFRLSLAALLVLISGCNPSGVTPPPAPPPSAVTPGPVELTVFAAASLAEAFTELGPQFEAAHPGITLIFNLAGSQVLAQQLRQAAPADVFASANQQQMDEAIQAGRVVTGTSSTFARNRLVVIYPLDNPGHLSALKDLARPGLRVILAASQVPAGQYALNFLDKTGKDAALGASFKQDVLGNVRSYEENVRAVLTKVTLGEADAGIVYTSDLSGKNAGQIGRLNIPEALNAIVEYPIAPVSDSSHPEVARAFVEYVLSPQGQAVLASHGFLTVPR